MMRRYRTQYSDILDPFDFRELDPAGNPWPSLEDIDEFMGCVPWTPDPDDPWYRWGWSWIIDETPERACEELRITPANWTRLSKATNPRIAAATALFALLRPQRPPFRTDRQFLKHITDAFNSTAPLTDPYRDAVEHICKELHREIEDCLQHSDPPFVYPGPLPHPHYIQRIYPFESSWPAFMWDARRIVRSEWKCAPSWEFARAMIGSERSSAAVLAARFAESIRYHVSPHAESRPDDLLEAEARAFSYLVVTEYRERGFLVGHIRELATTRHAPGQFIRVRRETQTGTAT